MKEAWFRRFCATLIGIVFFVSGVTKIIDPVGTSLIVEEYLKLFHLGFLSFAAPAAGFLFGIFEMTIAAAMLCKVYRLVFSFVTGGVIALFTIITLILVIVNPSMDCGCFGEALKINHMQSFLKNIALLLLSLGAFVRVFVDFFTLDKEKVIAQTAAEESAGDVDVDALAKERRSKRLYKYRNRKYRLAVFYLTVALAVGFTIHNRVNLPVVDFTAFTPGAQLASVSDVQAPRELSFIYEKDGERAEFTLENLPDSTWTFVAAADSQDGASDRSEAVLSLYDPTAGVYVDETLMEGNSLVISFYKKPSEKRLGEVSGLVETAVGFGLRPVIVCTEEVYEQLAGFADAGLADGVTGGLAEVYTSDRKTLMTLGRNNATATLIEDGVIVAKWAASGYPSSDTLSEYLSLETEEQVLRFVSFRKIGSQLLGLLILAVLVIY